jgi:uncharacterized protein YjbI with pentapeptide repeats
MQAWGAIARGRRRNNRVIGGCLLVYFGHGRRRHRPRRGDGQPQGSRALSALAIPVVLAAAGLWFTAQQDARQQNIEDRRAQQAQKIEDQRAAAERELAEQRAQDEALQAYLSQMGSLLLDKNLRESEEDSEVRTLARARTLTVLSRLDPSRKSAVMEFLVEAELVQSVEGRGPIIRLGGADLSGAEMSGADLSEANLSYADLSGADLTEADLPHASLSAANLRGAEVSQADLSYADLLYAQNWTDGQLGEAYLEGAIMPNGQKYGDWLKDK